MATTNDPTARTWSFPSERHPDTQPPYVTTLHDDGRLVCTCLGFRFNKPPVKGQPHTCGHTKSVVATLAGPRLAAHFLVKANGEPQETVSAKNGAEFAPRVHRIAPMLASALKASASMADYANSEHVLEIKYDGHRMEITVQVGGQSEAQSREGNIRSLPKHLTTQLARLAPGTYDGELFIPGGTATDVVVQSRAKELRIVLFDMMRVGDVPCIDQSGDDRRALLTVACGKLDGDAVSLAPQYPVSQAALDAIYAAGGEGAVIKRRSARTSLASGARTGSSSKRPSRRSSRSPDSSLASWRLRADRGGGFRRGDNHLQEYGGRGNGEHRGPARDRLRSQEPYRTLHAATV